MNINDKIGDTAKGKVLFVFEEMAVCKIVDDGLE